MSFWGELKRRNVYKVGVAYAIVAWLLIQAASIIFPHLNLPSWAVTFVIAFLIIGFPVALLLAWAYEVTPEGIKRTKNVPLAENIRHLTGQKLMYVVVALLVVAVAFLIFDNYILERETIEPELVSTETEQAPAFSEPVKAKKTIAVLPFTDLSPEKDQEYFVDGLSEEILNCLTKISDIRVIARTSSFSFKGTNKTVQEIASILGADHVLEGSVRKAGDTLRITAQLIQAADGTHLWSDTYDRVLKDIFIIQEDIATAVANELKTTLGIGQSLKQLGGTDNLEAYEHYLVAQSQFSDFEMDLALQSIDEAIAIDPEFALAWVLKSRLSFLFENKEGLQLALRSIELEPNLADGYAALGRIKHSTGDWVEAESAYRKAFELTNEPSITMINDSVGYYSTIGYFDKVRDLLEKALEKDPLNMWTRFSYIQYLGVKGDIRRAEEEDAHCRTLLMDRWNDNANWAITWVRLGSGEAVSRDRVLYSDPITDTAKEYLGSPKVGISKLRQIFSEDEHLTNGNLSDISIWAAYFDDPEFAMDAIERAFSLSAMRTEMIWLSVMKDVRQTPRFKEFIRDIGLVDFWNRFGWPDICRPLDNGDFECD